MDSVALWLLGVGHPEDSDSVGTISIPHEVVQKYQTDKLLRARLLLVAVTGTASIPMDPLWAMRVSTEYLFECSM